MLSTKVERLHSLILSHRHILRPQSNYVCLTARRSYAARNDRVAASSLLSSALEQKQRENRGEDYVGPFQLGLIPPTPRGGGNTKKWSELSTAGKGTSVAIQVSHSMTFTRRAVTAVARTTARTTNLAVILVGAGLSAVLIYALTSELFSKNSATVLYGQACEKVKASPAVRLASPRLLSDALTGWEACQISPGPAGLP